MGGGGEGGVDVADVGGRGGSLVESSLALAGGGGERIFGGSGLVPLDLEGGFGLEDGPGVLADDGDAGHQVVGIASAFEGEGVDDAGQLLDLVEVGGLDLAADGRAFGVVGNRACRGAGRRCRRWACR